MDQTLLLTASGTVAVLFVIAGLRVIKPYQQGVVHRLGRHVRVLKPGLRFILPFFDRVERVDMRERLVELPLQSVMTKDRVVVKTDGMLYFEVTDPAKLVYNIADFAGTAEKLAQTNLHNVIGEMELDDALSSRDVINAKLRQVLDDATGKWGVRIVRAEMKRMDPPADVTDAMHRQMKAEREKRAQILEAEGQQQARMLATDGEVEATRKAAEAERYKMEAEAKGKSHAITTVFNAIRKAEPNRELIALQYLDALKDISNGPANKVFLPYEASGILAALDGIRDLFKPPKTSANGKARR